MASRQTWTIAWPFGGRRPNGPPIGWRPRWTWLARAGRWNPSVRATAQRRSGVYALRDRATGNVVYVGSSNAGRLWKTILRHFQGRDTFAATGNWTHGAPERLDVAIVVTPAELAREKQQRTIDYYGPTGNVLAEEVPF